MRTSDLGPEVVPPKCALYSGKYGNVMVPNLETHVNSVFVFPGNTFSLCSGGHSKWTEDVFETLQHVSQNDATLSYDDIIRISWQDISIRRPLPALYRA